MAEVLPKQKMMRTLGFICSFLLSLNVLAGSNSICTDLFKDSCNDGVLEDGTGMTVHAEAAPQSARDAERVRRMVQKFFNSNSATLRQQALLHFGASDDAQIIAKLNDLLNRRQSTGSNGRYTAAELGFMEDFDFLSLINQVKYNGEVQVDIQEQESKVARLFPQIQEAIIRKIQSSQIEADKKARIIDRVLRVENLGTDCGRYFSGVYEETLPKAFYNPDSGGFLLCRNVLNQASSEFALTTIIAHEIAHSIDPCQLRATDSITFGSIVTDDLIKSESGFVYANLTSCLRQPNSVGVRNLTMESVHLQPVNSPASSAEYNFCNGSDQIREATSDWFASEIMSEVISKNYPGLSKRQWRNGMRNTFRVKCDQQHAEGFDTHPDLKERYNAVMLANRDIRAKMGCARVASPKIQCSLDIPAGRAGINANSSQNRTDFPASEPPQRSDSTDR